jgi:UDP-N-acetylglucosamine 1-carboxyvinyltransferase
MSYYRIEGGRPLSGSVRLHGAKNAASKLIIASLLTDEPCRFSNVPPIGEISLALDLVRSVGATAHQSGETVELTASTVHGTSGSQLSRRNRLPILAIGPLLHRTGRARVPQLGGDRIGPRPVNYHLEALRAFGATISELPDAFVAEATRLHGAKITLPYPSVSATESVLLTAVLAEGETQLQNAAVEPEVQELLAVLQRMGARVQLVADRTIAVTGVERLGGTTHTVMPDRLEAASYAAAALATGGRVELLGARQADLASYLTFLQAIGAGVTITDGAITVERVAPLRAGSVTTGVFPGFATDWQQPIVVGLTQADGLSTVHETVYEDRLGYADDLNRMGASIVVGTDCQGHPCRLADRDVRHSATITGPSPLHATTLTIPDIRAGMAHVVAALAAPGESRIESVEILDRGYAELAETLRSLGATIVRQDS